MRKSRHPSRCLERRLRGESQVLEAGKGQARAPGRGLPEAGLRWLLHLLTDSFKNMLMAAHDLLRTPRNGAKLQLMVVTGAGLCCQWFLHRSSWLAGSYCNPSFSCFYHRTEKKLNEGLHYPSFLHIAQPHTL